MGRDTERIGGKGRDETREEGRAAMACWFGKIFGSVTFMEREGEMTAERAREREHRSVRDSESERDDWHKI